MQHMHVQTIQTTYAQTQAMTQDAGINDRDIQTHKMLEHTNVLHTEILQL